MGWFESILGHMAEYTDPRGVPLHIGDHIQYVVRGSTHASTMNGHITAFVPAKDKYTEDKVTIELLGEIYFGRWIPVESLGRRSTQATVHVRNVLRVEYPEV